MHQQHLEENRDDISQLTYELLNSKSSITANEIMGVVFSVMRSRACFMEPKGDVEMVIEFVDKCNNERLSSSLFQIKEAYEYVFYEGDRLPKAPRPENIPLENKQV